MLQSSQKKTYDNHTNNSESESISGCASISLPSK
jgi:hypothetical protein